MTSSDVVRDAACAAVWWEVSSAPLHRLLDSDHPAALEGIKQALADGADWWGAAPMIGLFTIDEIGQAELGEQLLRVKEASIERERRADQATGGVGGGRAGNQRRSSQQQGSGDSAVAPGPLGRGQGALAALLHEPREEGDSQIASEAFHLARQVSSLTQDEQEDLKRRLDEWWPDKPFSETVSRTSDTSWSIEDRAASWLWLGPGLDMPISAERWPQLATCGVLAANHQTWLQRYATADAMREAAELLEAPELERWLQLLGVCSEPTPEEVFTQIAEHARSARSDHELALLAQQMVRSGNESAARGLAEAYPAFAAALRPALAANGEVEIQRDLLRELLARVRGGERPRREEAYWLTGLRDEAVLPELFELLRLVWESQPRGTDRDWFHYDLVNPVITAIAAIGGEGAVRGYDDLIAGGSVLRWLRPQRAELAQAIIDSVGLSVADTAAQAAGVPILNRDEPEPV